MAPRFTDEELAMLTDEEREGLLDEDLRDEGEGGSEGGAAGDGDPPGTEPADPAKEDADAGESGEGGKDAPEAGDAADPADPEAGTPADPDADPAGEGDPPPADQQQTRLRSALPDYDVPADVDDQIKTLRDQRRELATKFDDGELTAAEFHTQGDELADKIDDLRDLKRRGQISLDARIHAFTQEAVPQFLADHPEYEPGSVLYQALDHQLRTLQNEAMEDGKDGLNPALIQQAHDRIVEDLNRVRGKPAPKTADPAPGREIPPTLGDVPAAAEADFGDGGKFAAIDRLDGVEYEEALAKLTESEREQYMARP